MSESQFLTVTLANQCRACINLANVTRFHELDGKATFVLLDGTPLATAEDFETLALRLGAEIPPPAVPREQMALPPLPPPPPPAWSDPGIGVRP